MLGIWGMGGIGKTSLLNYLQLHYTRDDCIGFKHVIFVHAGRECTPAKLRDVISISIGLPLVSDNTQRAQLQNYLKDKSFLVLIDEVWRWSSVDPEEVGIPPRQFGEHNQKIVFTTRDLDVCAKFANSTIHLECLTDADAWGLFIEKLGKQVAKHILTHAKKIVALCGGLPGALCTVAEAMSTKTGSGEWSCFCDRLESNTRLINTLGHDLFNRLKLSYDDMSDTFKECFLVCSLWPERENIPREKLISWWIGLGLVDPAAAIETGNDRIGILLRTSMLEDGDCGLYSSENSYVKMHPLVRKMAIWILNGEGQSIRMLPYSFCRPALGAKKWRSVRKAWSSMEDSCNWSASTSFSELTMLVARHSIPSNIIPCFAGIIFLDLEGTKMNKFPIEICALKKLHYINLSATSIDGLPMELSELSDLRYLYVRNTGALQALPQGLISSLKNLCVLDLFCSGISVNIVQYIPYVVEELTRNMVLLMLGISVCTLEDITNLLHLDIESICSLCMHHFEAEGTDLMLLSDLTNLRELAIINCSVINELIAEWNPAYYEDGMLPKLEYLELSNLPNLRKVSWKNVGFGLRVLTISHCMKLENVNWVHQLQSLEELTIAYCQGIERLFDNDVVANQREVTFPSLRRLYLEQLPKLSIISEEALPFEQLAYIRIDGCKNLKVIRVGLRFNQIKIKLDCSKYWWQDITSQNQQTMRLYFQTNFCF